MAGTGCGAFDPDRLLADQPDDLPAGRPREFPALGLARQAGISGKTYPTVLSAADEVAVEAFLNDRIRFIDIAPVVESALAAHDPVTVTELAAIVEADEWARATTREIIDHRVGSS